MTAVFRSCLSRFNSNTNQLVSIEKSSSLIACEENCSKCTDDSTSTQLDSLSIKNAKNVKLFRKRSSRKISLKKRGSCYSRINNKQKPFLKGLMSKIFGDTIYLNNHSKQYQSSQKTRTILPSQSTIKRQFDNNEQTLNSLIKLLTKINSNMKLTEVSKNNEQQCARNNNRVDDTYSLNSLISKHNYKKQYLHTENNYDDNTHTSTSSIISNFRRDLSAIDRRKMVDNQQQTQIYTETSTQFNQTNSFVTSESSWFEFMREDPTTVNAWARIRRRLQPNQQKDILRALMIICANLFEVPMENKHI